MLVPAGNHKIEFRFEPAVYQTGEKIARFSSVGLLLLVLAAGILTVRKNTTKRA
jgi:hypothetical protein